MRPGFLAQGKKVPPAGSEVQQQSQWKGSLTAPTSSVTGSAASTTNTDAAGTIQASCMDNEEAALSNGTQHYTAQQQKKPETQVQWQTAEVSSQEQTRPKQMSAGQPGPGPSWDQQFAQCLALLAGPTDEKRFVGLLLVTKLLPQGTDQAVRQVLDALGFTFIHRLLLPLSRAAQGLCPPPPGDAQQQLLCCGLGLAILSAGCRLPEVAAGEEMRAAVPACVKAVHTGGVSRVIPGATAVPEAIVTDQAAVSDALDCLLTSCSHSQQALKEALHAGVFSACVTAVSRHMQMGAAVVMQVLRVLACVLAADAQTRSAYLAPGDAQQLVSLVNSLSQIFGSPVLTEAASDHAATSAASASDTEPIASARHSHVPSSSGSAATATAKDAAMLQLEALHLLLLLLPDVLGVHEAQEQLHMQDAASDEPNWSSLIRHGLLVLLQSRVSLVQKHSALRLAAATVEVVGPGWLLAKDDAKPELLLLLLADTLQVEVGLLLSDALHPDASVPALDQPSTSAMSNGIGPQPSAKLLKELAEKADAMAIDREEDDNDVSAPEPEARSMLQQTQQRWQSAGQRAQHMLPSCFLLIESVIEALAEDMAREDAMLEGDASQLDLPLLSHQAAQKVMAVLHACIEQLLQFYEVAFIPQFAEDGGTPITPPILAPELLLAGVRVLGRYLAETPESLSEPLLKLLPHLLSLSPVSTSGQQTWAAQFLLPGLLMACMQSPEVSQRVAGAILSSHQALEGLCGYALYCVQEARTCLEKLPAGFTSCDSQHTVSSPAMLLIVSDLQRAEHGLADVAILISQVITAPGASASAAARSSTASPASSTSAPNNVHDHPDQPSTTQWSMALQQSLLAALARWSQSRMGAWSQLSSLDLARQYESIIACMYSQKLMPRPLLCSAALAAHVLVQLPLYDASQNGNPSLGTSHDALCHLLGEQAVLESYELVLLGVQAGCCLQLADIGSEKIHNAEGSRAADEGGLQLVMQEFQGDAEVCWDRCLHAVLCLTEQSPSFLMKAISKSWVQQLVTAAISNSESGTVKELVLLLDEHIQLKLWCKTLQAISAS